MGADVNPSMATPIITQRGVLGVAAKRQKLN